MDLLECVCCGYEGDELNIKKCLICNSMCCQPCILEHPCEEGCSNYSRPSPFMKTINETNRDILHENGGSIV